MEDYIWCKGRVFLIDIGVRIAQWKNIIKYKILLDKFEFSVYLLWLSGKKWEKVVWILKMRGVKECFGVGMNIP